MSEVNTTEVSIDNENEFVAQVRTTGVVVAGGDAVLRTEGEGRQTRYFVGDEQVRKAEVVEEFRARQSDDDPSVTVHVPADAEHEHGDVVCRVCGKALGYLTGSHMKTHDEGPTTIDGYRAMVAEADGVEPSEVPLCTDDLFATFEAAGNIDEETRRQLSEHNKARWEAGEYDHLRASEDDESADEASA
jgi:hypothetical protein